MWDYVIISKRKFNGEIWKAFKEGVNYQKKLDYLRELREQRELAVPKCISENFKERL